jgi:hypothetical protein
VLRYLGANKKSFKAALTFSTVPKAGTNFSTNASVIGVYSTNCGSTEGRVSSKKKGSMPSPVEGERPVMLLCKMF